MEPPKQNTGICLNPNSTSGGKQPARGDSASPRDDSWLHAFEVEPFVARRGLRSGHAQTIASHLLSRTTQLGPGERVLVQVEPEVQVLCIGHWQASRAEATTLIIVHGLEGSSDSQYVVGLANKAFAAGMNVVRMNVRNCGGTEKLAATLYHSGMSDDIDRVTRFFIERDCLPAIVLAGFSMGGNQVLKLVGEWSDAAPAEVIGAAAISPAMDLGPSADAIHSLQNRLYELRFLTSLRGRMKRKVALFPDKFKVERWWWKSIRDFDDALTAPHFGFTSAEDYYTRASSSRVLEHIRVPTLVVHATDDPFIRVMTDTYEKLRANPCIKFVETEHGGHCGFLADPRETKAQGYDGRWSERQIVRFCEAAQQRTLSHAARGGESEADEDTPSR
jgi:uncharacterized protein